MFHHFLSSTISQSTSRLVSSQLWPWPWLAFRLISTSSSSSSSRSKRNSFVVSYLTGTCGFSPERAVSVSKRINFDTGEKPDTAIEFFKNQGFSLTASFRLCRSVPSLLIANPEKSLQPKFDFFKSKGFSASDIRNIVVGCPTILTRSLQNEIIPCFDFFDKMFQSKEKLMKAVIGYSGILSDLDKYAAPNIKLLREEGVPEPLIVRFIECYPRALKTNPKRFKELVKEVKELGFDPLKLQFFVVVHIKTRTRSSTWAKREGIYRKWGWSDYDISAAFRVHPWCITVSENKVEVVLDFLVNRLGYKSADIARCPVVLSMSLEKRIIPRGSVVLDLLSKGLVKKLSLSAIYKCNEKAFLNRYIFPQEKEADELLKLYKDKMA